MNLLHKTRVIAIWKWAIFAATFYINSSYNCYISTRVDIKTAYQHGKCFIFVKYISTQSIGFLTFLRLLGNNSCSSGSFEGRSICCPLSLKALFVAKTVSLRFLQACKTTLVDSNFDCYPLSFRSATLFGL